MAKKWYLSKTLWFNLLALVAAIAAQFGYAGDLPANWEPLVTVGVLLVNLVLRFLTKVPVRL